MKTKRIRYKSGFTLIELMIVLVILSVLTPAVYRLYHEGFRSSHSNFYKVSKTIRDTDILFDYLSSDLKSSTTLIPSFGQYHTDQGTLIIKGIGLKKRVELIKKDGNLTDEILKSDHECVIVYTRNDYAEIVRKEYVGSITSKNSARLHDENEEMIIIKTPEFEDGVFYMRESNQTVLLGDVLNLYFSYQPDAPDEIQRIDVQLFRSKGYKEIWPVGSLYRTYHLVR